MKTKITTLKLLAVLCCSLVTTTVFGQAVVVWDGSGDGTNFDQALNYVGDVLPSTANQDICQFNGTVPGNLALNYSGGGFASGFGQSGISIQMTPSQTGNLSIDNLSANNNPGNLAIYDILIESGAGAFSWGANGRRVNYVGRPTAAVHTWANNSAFPATIGNNIRWLAGGGQAYTMAFGGTGDWNLNSYLQTDNGAGNVIVQKDGTGTLTWNPSGFSGGDGVGTITINAGTLALTAPHPKANNSAIANSGTFIYNAPSQAQTLSGVISGFGELQVGGGTLTLSGASTYSGNTVLNGGTVVVNGAENAGVSGPLGLGGTISFTGGTLGFSVNNTFDYSSRFSTAAGQAVRIETGGQNVTLAGALTSSGGTLTKLGQGTLTLSGANTYNGLTTVSSGKLVIQGSAGPGNITVADNTALGVTGGSQIQPGTLTVGTSGSATLEFNNVTSTTTSLIAAGTVSAGGPITINVNSGTFAVGQNYPLLSWTSGSAPAVVLGNVIGATGTLNTNGNTIQLNVSALAYTWAGTTDGNWDTTTANNWLLGGNPVTYSDPNPVLFDDTAPGSTAVTVNSVVQPGNATINNNSLTYSIASSGANRISGGASLSKVGGGTLALSGGVNDYTGATTVNGGIMNVGTLANGGAASDIGASGSGAANLVLNGGTLDYTGAGATSDRLFTLGTAGGRIRSLGSGTLNLDNAGVIGLSGGGARTLTLNATNAAGDTLGATLADGGGPTAVTKTGPGKWILTGNNTNSGLTTIAAGNLQIGNGGASGSPGSGNIVNNGSLTFNRSGTLTVSGSISGTGPVTNAGPGTVILAADQTYTGDTYVNGGTLQFGNGGASGTIFGNAAVVLSNNATVIFNTTTPMTIFGGFGNDLTGDGNVIVRAGYVTAGDGADIVYTGWTLIEPGATFQPLTGLTTGFGSSGVTNNGRLALVGQDVGVFGISNNIVGTGSVFADTRNQNAGAAILAGNNTYTGGTFIGGGGLILGDGVTAGAGSIVGSVVFTNTTGPFLFLNTPSKRLFLNRPDTYTFTNDLVSMVSDGSSAANSGSLEVQLGNVTLTGNNSYPGTTTVAAGATLQSGNGGTGGSIGSGDKAIEGTLIFNRSVDATINGVVSGAAGSLIKDGSGTLTLTNANTFSGSTTVSNGTLIINGSDSAFQTTVEGGTLGGSGTFNGGAVTLNAGATLAPGASVGTMTFNAGLTLNSANLAIEVDKSLGQPNDVITAFGLTTVTGSGTITVANLGPALQVGDKFTLFDFPVVNGSSLNVTGAGATWQNDLETDGSITVLTAAAPQPTLNFTHAGGNNLEFTWSEAGFKLQSQTNSLDTGISGNWGDYPGGGTSPVNVAIDPATGTVFFRLAPTP